MKGLLCNAELTQFEYPHANASNPTDVTTTCGDLIGVRGSA
jgi:hypothetical protein